MSSTKAYNALRNATRYNWPFPRRGGGWGRRYARVHIDMYQRQWGTPYAYPYEPINVFDFSHPDDAVDARMVDERDLDGWRVSDDGVIGGYSKSTARFVPAAMEHDNDDNESTDNSLETEGGNDAADSEKEGEGDSEMTQHNQPLNLPHIHWDGFVDTSTGLESKVDRAGFAAIRSPAFPFEGMDLKAGYDALEITCRSDARVYTVNLSVNSFIPNDIYQGQIIGGDADATTRATTNGQEDNSLDLSKQQWQTLYLPFSEFGSGRRRLETRIQILAIGFTLMDGNTGPFQFDLARIRAVNFYRGHVYEGPETLKKRVENTRHLDSYN